MSAPDPLVRVTRFATVTGDEAVEPPNWIPAGQRRRLDSLTRLAACALGRLLSPGERLHPDTAIVVNTSYGAIDSTLRFVRSIAEFGDRTASPTPFTTSVHNSCAGAFGELLHVHGPSTTLSQGGVGTVSALRWAQLMLRSGRAPAVLVVVGDRHNDWSRKVVGELSGLQWPVADGVAVALVEGGDVPGRELRLGRHAAARCLDGGGMTATDERALAVAAQGSARVRAPDVAGGWWPCCLFAGLRAEDWRADQPLQLREVEDGRIAEAWLGPWLQPACA